MTASIGVIIATYNGAAFINDALDSLAAQTRPLDDIIVVDDASTDDTVALAAEHPLAPRVIRQPQNRGVAAARNRGVSELATSHVALLDQDDLWHPERAAVLADELANHPEHDLVVTDVQAFALVGDQRRLEDHPYRTWIDRWVESPAELLEDPQRSLSTSAPRSPLTVARYLSGPVSVTCSSLYRRACMLEAGGFATWLRSADDWVLETAMARLTSAIHLGEPSVWYRVHPRNTSVDSDWPLPLLTARAALQHGGNLVAGHSTAPVMSSAPFWTDLIDRLARSDRPHGLADALAVAQLTGADRADLRALRRLALRRRAGVLKRRLLGRRSQGTGG